MRLISTRTRTKKYVNKPQEVKRSKENKQSAGRQPRPDDRGRREAQCTALRKVVFFRAADEQRCQLSRITRRHRCDLDCLTNTLGDNPMHMITAAITIHYPEKKK